MPQTMQLPAAKAPKLIYVLALIVTAALGVASYYYGADILQMFKGEIITEQNCLRIPVRIQEEFDQLIAQGEGIWKEIGVNLESTRSAYKNAQTARDQAIKLGKFTTTGNCQQGYAFIENILGLATGEGICLQEGNEIDNFMKMIKDPEITQQWTALITTYNEKKAAWDTAYTQAQPKIAELTLITTALEQLADQNTNEKQCRLNNQDPALLLRTAVQKIAE